MGSTLRYATLRYGTEYAIHYHYQKSMSTSMGSNWLSEEDVWDEAGMTDCMSQVQSQGTEMIESGRGGTLSIIDANREFVHTLIAGGDRRHRREHESLRIASLAYIEVWRDRVGLSPNWQVQVDIRCPADLRGREAQIQAHRPFYYAWLSLRCDIPDDLVEWLVVHELCELQRYGSSQAVHTLLSTVPATKSLLPLVERLKVEWDMEREREIEERVYALLHTRRPAHLYEYEDSGDSESEGDEKEDG